MGSRSSLSLPGAARLLLDVSSYFPLLSSLVSVPRSSPFVLSSFLRFCLMSLIFLFCFGGYVISNVVGADICMLR